MPACTTPRVCFYARSSNTRHAAAGLGRQIEAARHWCAQHDLALTDILLEERGRSETPDRSKFDRLMAQALRGAVPFDVLLVHSLCRLSRHPARLALLLKRLERAKVQVRAITGEMPDLSVDPVQREGKVR
ncbi:MAG: hypothetical protein AVDCRST_MAG31-2377 [uncultured Sphingomonas sp.]|uniref:Resolvase/invertase-type recombinase catalytic domain-containing protein n=1 Tax=uncultured Sphingomonas sp. TaxID=158754 RepID=A0A6J4TUN5_9SPHN|nr:recombinase family protein [uncultured Sphingomonas sp.]CAA9530878.1 MAG: hypothetical protein AVDCRST_MAG31-2377 [uncultured Sphingomonas sp.]